MKKLLLIAGVVLIIVCVLSLLYSFLNLFGYYNVLDGSPELYTKMHSRMIVFFAVGIVLALLGTACIVIKSRM